MMYTCPVCGYDQLDEPPQDWSICPCCRTQFDFTGSVAWYAELRARWIANGAKWSSRYTAPPPNWNPLEQLCNIGYEATERDRTMIERHKHSPVG
jgi:hypothetical protein